MIAPRFPRSAREARRRGQYFYYTGKPCRRGYYAARDVVYNQCQCDACRALRRKS